MLGLWVFGVEWTGSSTIQQVFEAASLDHADQGLLLVCAAVELVFRSSESGSASSDSESASSWVASVCAAVAGFFAPGLGGGR